MPIYRMNGMTVHLKFSGKAAKNPPVPCCARVPIAQLSGAEIPLNASERVMRCRAISTFACDWPVEDGTCDAPLCPQHATEIAPDHHLCPLHLRMYRERTPELF